MTVGELRQRRAARGMSDPLNRLRARNAAHADEAVTEVRDLCYACGQRPATAWTSETAGMCEECRADELARQDERWLDHGRALGQLLRDSAPAPVRHAQRQREAWRDHAAELPGWVSDDSPVLALAEAGWQAKAAA